MPLPDRRVRLPAEGGRRQSRPPGEVSVRQAHEGRWHRPHQNEHRRQGGQDVDLAAAVTAPLSTFTLLQRSVDYAGTFPPATLPLSEAVANYAQERSGPRAWLLGRLVVCASGLDALETLLPQP